jgi:hypothetical protein
MLPQSTLRASKKPNSLALVCKSWSDRPLIKISTRRIGGRQLKIKDVVGCAGSFSKATAVRQPPEECYLRARTSRALLTVRHLLTQSDLAQPRGDRFCAASFVEHYQRANRSLFQLVSTDPIGRPPPAPASVDKFRQISHLRPQPSVPGDFLRTFPRRSSPSVRPLKFARPVPLCLTRRFRHIQGAFQPSRRPQHPLSEGSH